MSLNKIQPIEDLSFDMQCILGIGGDEFKARVAYTLKNIENGGLLNSAQTILEGMENNDLKVQKELIDMFFAGTYDIEAAIIQKKEPEYMEELNNYRNIIEKMYQIGVMSEGKKGTHQLEITQ